MPSAAFGLIENPSGRVTVFALSSEGEGVFGSWNWGTLSVTSRPEAVSVSVVVGLAARLGSKLSASQPVVAGHGAFRMVGFEVVGEVVDGGRQRADAGGRVLGQRSDRQRGRVRFVRCCRCTLF